MTAKFVLMTVMVFITFLMFDVVSANIHDVEAVDVAARGLDVYYGGIQVRETETCGCTVTTIPEWCQATTSVGTSILPVPVTATLTQSAGASGTASSNVPVTSLLSSEVSSLSSAYMSATNSASSALASMSSELSSAMSTLGTATTTATESTISTGLGPAPSEGTSPAGPAATTSASAPLTGGTANNAPDMVAFILAPALLSAAFALVA